MKKCISLFFGFLSPVEERIKKIKEAGFDGVITTADPRFDYQNGKLSKQMKLFKKYGLGVSSLHARYVKEELPKFWLEGKDGDKIKKDIIKDVKLAKKYGFKCVVVHMRGFYSKIGEKRFMDILKVCEKYNIPLAVENLLSSKIFMDIFKNISHPYLKFCYDSGHDHCDHSNFDYLSLYADKLVTLHLHDNDGTDDHHTLNQLGTTDWDMIASKLAKINPNINLDYELIYVKKVQGYSEDDVLRETKQQADELEQMINEKTKKAD